MNLTERIKASQQKRHSLLCLGLDPDPSRHDEDVSFDCIAEFLLETVRQTRDKVAAYKPNLAFYLSLGVEGIELLRDLRDEVPEDSVFILDSKWGDIGNTIERYATFGLEYVGADVVTAHPYMGRDGIEPFVRDESTGVFLLCRTSNPNGDAIQMFPSSENPLFMHVADLAAEWNTNRNIGLVVGATFPGEMARVRQEHPDLLFLVPGVGAQGGTIKEVLDAAGEGLLIAASRSLLYPIKGSASPEDVVKAVEKANEEVAAHNKQI